MRPLVLTTLATVALGGITALMSVEPPHYRFRVLATIPGPAPGPEGDKFTPDASDFEPGQLNGRSDLALVADLVDANGNPIGEGVFVESHGSLSRIVRPGQSAPGGGVFVGASGRAALNDPGDVAFTAALDPFSFPIGANSGLYWKGGQIASLNAVVVPGVTASPTGGKFIGVTLAHQPSLNNRGEIVFGGIVPTANGIHLSYESYLGLGTGIFRADANGAILGLVIPGDPAPGGGTLDYADFGSVNDAGDIAFGGHVAGTECITGHSPSQHPPQAEQIGCAAGIYVRRAHSGELVPAVLPGQAAPGGGVFRSGGLATINNTGQVVFHGDLTPPPDHLVSLGYFLYSQGQLVSLGRPGDLMPGGGHFVRASLLDLDLNARGDAVFSATLDTDDNGDGLHDTGLFVWSMGSVRLVARTGTVIPGIGTIAHLQDPPEVGFGRPHSNAVINPRGEIAFQATLADGRGVLLIAAPEN